MKKRLARMGRFLLVVMGLALVATFASQTANANGVTCTGGGDGCLNANDNFDWYVNFGEAYNDIPNDSYLITSFTGQPGFLHFEGGGDGERVDEGLGWQGNFNRGAWLLWTKGQGPLTFIFSGVTGAGAFIQAHAFGPFTARVQAYGFDGNLMESFSEQGYSNGNEDGSAIYIGLDESGSPGIAALTFSLTDANGDLADFAIGQLDVFVPYDDTGVPEPTSLLLLGTGLFGVAGLGRKRLGKRS